MFRISCPVLVMALLMIGPSIQTATAQASVPALAPNVDLTSSLDAGPQGQAFQPRSPVVRIGPLTSQGSQLFNDPPPAEGGWKALASLLEAASPSVDTALPLTSSQITARISAMLDQGRTEEALQVIEKRSAQLEAQGGSGTDVQLMFLHGRALGALGRQNDAIDVYLKMTTLYPELPEPWNNLASEYVKQDKLDMALDALNMAVTANPNYGTARANLGEVQLMLARRSFENAAKLGVDQAGSKATQTGRILAH